LAEERRRYLAHCATQQMTRRTLRNIARYTLLAAEALRLAERPQDVITRAEVAAAVEGWAARRSRRSTARQGRILRVDFTGHVLRWLTFLGRLQAVAEAPQPYADHLAQFIDRLQERGLSPRTIATYRDVLRPFLAQLEGAGLCLKTLAVTHLDALVIHRFLEERYARKTLQKWALVIRLFLRYAEERGWCRQGLAAAIMAPRVGTHEGLPLGPSWGDVQRLLAAAHGDRRADIRDRALLLLLAVYGLRAGEVTALSLQDFDWERAVLIVPRSKSQRPRTYPLCRPVGDAVLRYLCEVRPRSDLRQVFLTLVPPFRPLLVSGLGRAVRRRVQALGLTWPHCGPHALRHACAMHLLAQGLSLKEIGDHLGHQSPEATRFYAKVDLAALHAVADFDLKELL
jgi:site-specific recombinase XerD